MASSVNPHVASPSIAVVATITPSTYKRGESENAIPILSIKATLDASAPKPVTVNTWHTIFNLGLALKRRSFTVQDLTQNPPANISLEISKGPKRPDFRRIKGSGDEKYYVTLHPAQETIVAEHPLNIVRRTENELPVFRAGHVYQIGLSEEGIMVRDWWWGTTDDVLAEVGEPPEDVSDIRGTGSIELLMEPVVFKVVG
ncbi:hypothetical protein F5Y15DRAFT_340959 [Xylariaceae sp. FL0016]|nr:hypothetical protein F5Y15DRAFT_340959 [Xylariaceae sp. FL0016]